MGRPRKKPLEFARCPACKKPIYRGDRVARILAARIDDEAGFHRTQADDLAVTHRACLDDWLDPAAAAMEHIRSHAEKNTKARFDPSKLKAQAPPSLSQSHFFHKRDEKK